MERINIKVYFQGPINLRKDDEIIIRKFTNTNEPYEALILENVSAGATFTSTLPLNVTRGTAENEIFGNIVSSITVNNKTEFVLDTERLWTKEEKEIAFKKEMEAKDQRIRELEEANKKKK